MRFLFIGYFFSIQFAIAQNPQDFIKKANATIMEASNLEFLEQLSGPFFRVAQSQNQAQFILTNDSTHFESTFEVHYYLNGFSVQTTNEGGGTSTFNSLIFHYDSSMNLLNGPNVENIFKGYQKFLSASMHPRRTIKKEAKSHSSFKRPSKIFMSEPTYDLSNDYFFREITLEKGFKKVKGEWIEIRSDNLEIISKKEYKGYFTFWRAIANRFEHW